MTDKTPMWLNNSSLINLEILFFFYFVESDCMQALPCILLAEVAAA